MPPNRSRAQFVHTLLAIAALVAAPLAAAPLAYPWLEQQSQPDTLLTRLLPPTGYSRQPSQPGSFEQWLRHLPLKPSGSAVHLHTGALKGNQSAHAAVFDVDVGKRDLQQCADAVMRLRAEYLYGQGQYDAIHFRFTSGAESSFQRWSEGYRARVAGNNVTWVQTGEKGTNYRSFRKYLDTVFTYAGTASLARELRLVADRAQMRIGDVFIQGGFPGHAVLVVDMATHSTTGRKVFLLAQSYMPAQEIHILKNPGDPALSPWYPLEFGAMLETPEWTFRPTDLRRF